jgi:hypothetical protein
VSAGTDLRARLSATVDIATARETQSSTLTIQITVFVQVGNDPDQQISGEPKQMAWGTYVSFQDTASEVLLKGD